MKTGTGGIFALLAIIAGGVALSGWKGGGAGPAAEAKDPAREAAEYQSAEAILEGIGIDVSNIPSSLLETFIEQERALPLQSQILLSSGAQAAAVIQQSPLPLAPVLVQQVQQEVKTFTAGVTPMVTGLLATGQGGQATAVALMAPLVAAAKAAAMVKFQSDMAAWSQKLAIATATGNYVQIQKLSTQQPVRPQ